MAAGAESSHVEEDEDDQGEAAPEEEGRRADQSETPNSLKKPMARQ